MSNHSGIFHSSFFLSPSSSSSVYYIQLSQMVLTVAQRTHFLPFSYVPAHFDVG